MWKAKYFASQGNSNGSGFEDLVKNDNLSRPQSMTKESKYSNKKTPDSLTTSNFSSIKMNKKILP